MSRSSFSVSRSRALAIWRKKVLGGNISRRVFPGATSEAIRNSWASEVSRSDFTEALRLAPQINFVWIPKSAGTSISVWLQEEIALQRFLNIRQLARLSKDEAGPIKALTFGHQSIDWLMDHSVVSSEALVGAYNFSFIRNPYDRVISLWRYLVRIGKYPRVAGFDRFVGDVVRERPYPGPFNRHGLSMASPMSSWVKNRSWHGEIDLYRFENFETEISRLASRLGIKTFPTRLNTAKSSPPVLRIQAATLGRLRDFYGTDFEFFAYSDDHSKYFQLR